MYRIDPQRLYAMDWALDDPRNLVRLESLLKGLGRPQSEVQVIRKEDLPEVISEAGWIGEVRQGSYPEPRDPDFIFTAFHWVTNAERAEVMKSELFQQCVAAHNTFGDCAQGFVKSRVLAMLGAAPFYHYEKRPDWNPTHVCWCLHDIHSAWGCVHRCAYCQRGSVYAVNLNVEEFVEQVDELRREHSWQQTFRYDVEQDVLAIEPEYGACELLVKHFAQLDEQYLILFSKSANIDFLLDLDHRGHTIMLWTLSTHTASRRYEGRTGTMEQRLEAARKCQEAGYPVRFKMKPIIPIADWRAETTQMLEQLYATVTPENLSMEMVFFDTVAEIDSALGLEDMDPAIAADCRRAEAALDGPWPKARDGMPPFTHEAKEMVYRYTMEESHRISPETPITLCAETQRMWAALDDVVDGKPWNYVCNCGPRCTPGLMTLKPVEGPDAERVRAAERLGRIPS